MSKQSHSTESLTPAQLNLLQYLDHLNAAEIAEALKEVHELGTYYPDKDLVNLSASRQVHWLYDLVFALAAEYEKQKTVSTNP